MYVQLLRRHLASIPRRTALWIKRRRPILSSVLLIVLAFSAFVAVRERGRGHLSRLKSELKTQTNAELPPPPQPGGQDPVVLQRSQMAGSTMPEFLSATLLPGRGMNTLQITAFLPDKGEVELLDAPTVEGVAKALQASAATGASLQLGGTLELPWAGNLAGTRSGDQKGITTMWHGHSLTLPASDTVAGVAVASSGLLVNKRSTAISSNVMPDGGEAQATFSLGNFDGRWPSSTEAKATVLLSGRAVEIRVVARNTGTEAEPIGIGWLPRFAILSGDRAQVRLHIPASDSIEHRAGSGLPTGRLLPVTGTSRDFTSHEGVPLRSIALDDTFVHLRPALLDLGPMVELRDPRSNYGLRLTALTPTIRAIHVETAPGSNSITIDPRFNYDDPFGHEWAYGDDTGIVTLEPGKSVQWRIRLELFPISAPVSPGL